MGSERSITVSTTPIRLFAASPSRINYTLQNQGAVDLYLGQTDQVALTGERKGRTLPPQALESCTARDEPQLIHGETWALIAAGSITVWVWDE